MSQQTSQLRICAGFVQNTGEKVDCQVDVSDTHHSTRRCPSCKKEHVRLQRNRYQRKYQQQKHAKAKVQRLAELIGIEERLRRELGEAVAEMAEIIGRHDKQILDLMSELNDLRDPPSRWSLLVEAWGKGTHQRKGRRQLHSGSP